MTSSRVSGFEASLMKIKNEFFCEGVNVTFATSRTIIVSEGYLIICSCHDFN